MIKILFDTNIFIYLEDNKVADSKVTELTKRLYDTNEYKIVIHPKTKYEIRKMKDEEQRKIFESKIAIYKEIINPPVPNEKFHLEVGCNNSHDVIDNELLFAVKRNCVSYLISNDKAVKLKSAKLGISNRVLSIEEALKKFVLEEEKEIFYPVFVQKKYLYELDIDDTFFDSLRDDYYNFNIWFENKQKNSNQAYITQDNGKITAFLMMKVENEEENYGDFEKKFKNAKRLKISTIKVSDTGKKIGETFIKVIMKKAIQENVEEIYLTVFDKQEHLIDVFNSYGFNYYCKKSTRIGNGQIKSENVYVKKITDPDEYYPFFSIENKKIFLVPIREKFHNLLFSDSEKMQQLSIDEMEGKNTASNSIRKAYISHSNIKKIESGSILLFYSSGVKKAITTLGIVDATFNQFTNYEEMYRLVKRRTAYSDKELKEMYKKDALLILFKHYHSFNKYVSFDFLLKNQIVYGPVQCITEIKKEDLQKILKECKIDQNIYVLN